MKEFNTAGTCFPKRHYMVDISERVSIIQNMVDKGDYFCINRGRQYGKTTTLQAISNSLSDNYLIISISFEGLSDSSFATIDTLAYTFVKSLNFQMRMQPAQYGELLKKLVSDAVNDNNREIQSDDFSFLISQLCLSSDKPIVLLIDEVDQAGNHDSFIKFLGLLRNKYLARDKYPTFQSVILAGVYDIKNLKLKVRDENEHQYNSPWNIAAPFDIDMSLHADGIKLFLLYLKSIINGVGNYYIEAETRDETRTDIVIDYLGNQYVIELKIWRGNSYNERGEQQLAEYLDYFHLETGYLVSFCFNRKKEPETKTMNVGGRTVYEAVV